MAASKVVCCCVLALLVSGAAARSLLQAGKPAQCTGKTSWGPSAISCQWKCGEASWRVRCACEAATKCATVACKASVQRGHACILETPCA